MDIVRFKSISEVNRYVDDEIAKLRTSLSEHLKRLEVVHERAEKIRKTKETILELVGASDTSGSVEGREADLGGVKVLLNATPDQEETVLQQATSSVRARLEALEKVKKAMEPLARIQDVSGIDGMIVTENGIPIELVMNFGRA